MSRPIDFLGQATAASWDFQLTNSFEQRTFSDDWTLVKRFLEKAGVDITFHIFHFEDCTDITRCQNSPSIGFQRSSHSGCLQEKSVLTASQRPCRGATWIPQRALCQSWPKHQLNSGKVGKSFGWKFVSTVSNWLPYLPCCESMPGCVLFDSLRCTWREVMTKRRSHPRAPQRFRSPRKITRVTGRSAWSLEVIQ